MNIILGSQSKGRAKVLTELGISFTQMSADIDEKSIRHEDATQLTLLLSRAKADALLLKIQERAILITSDSVVVCDGKILEKPVDATEVREFLAMYAKHPAQTVTSVVAANTETGKRAEGTDIATIFFKEVPAERVEEIIAEGICFTQAGGFGVQNPLFQPFVTIEGEIESVMAMPKALTLRLLAEVGYDQTAKTISA
ncbi:MAG: Maf family protein [Patescibacteria group bacterium]